MLTLTETAATKVKDFMNGQSEDENIALRVAVQAGGCSGMRYALFFDDRMLDGDEEITQHGVRVRVDRMSSPYLSGATVDWTESLEASGFAIDNPNAQHSCACGDSFS